MPANLKSNQVWHVQGFFDSMMGRYSKNFSSNMWDHQLYKYPWRIVVIQDWHDDNEKWCGLLFSLTPVEGLERTCFCGSKCLFGFQILSIWSGRKSFCRERLQLPAPGWCGELGELTGRVGGFKRLRNWRCKFTCVYDVYVICLWNSGQNCVGAKVACLDQQRHGRILNEYMTHQLWGQLTPVFRRWVGSLRRIPVSVLMHVIMKKNDWRSEEIYMRREDMTQGFLFVDSFEETWAALADRLQRLGEWSLAELNPFLSVVDSM